MAADATRFGFARDSHVIPALIDEFAAASTQLPIVFAPGPGAPASVFLVGVRAGKCALVDNDGRWTGDYIPAYLRRYPFVLGQVEGRDPLVCVDQTNLSETEGETLFQEDGTDTQLLTGNIQFTNEYFMAAKRNDAMMKALVDLALLQPMTIDAKFEGGESLTLHGFFMVDAAKLQALPDADFLNLRKEGFLAPIYAHLFSLSNIERVRRLS